jgi:hypothetical protein
MAKSTRQTSLQLTRRDRHFRRRQQPGSNSRGRGHGNRLLQSAAPLCILSTLGYGLQSLTLEGRLETGQRLVEESSQTQTQPPFAPTPRPSVIRSVFFGDQPPITGNGFEPHPKQSLVSHYDDAQLTAYSFENTPDARRHTQSSILLMLLMLRPLARVVHQTPLRCGIHVDRFPCSGDTLRAQRHGANVSTGSALAPTSRQGSRSASLPPVGLDRSATIRLGSRMT